MSKRSGQERIGVIGLGAMGGPMAKRLTDAGFTVYVTDTDPRRVADLVRVGAAALRNPGEVAQRSDVTILSLPNSRIVEQVVLGQRGIAEGALAGHVVVDMSSSEPDSTLAIGKALQDHDVGMLDAPVSRGASAAKEGTLSILVGGDPEILARCRPMLDNLGTDIVHVGALGAGHAAKALNNHLAATTLLAAIEGFVVAARAGVRPSTAVTAINQGSGRSHMSEVRFPRYYLPRQFDSDFTLGLMHKDCRIAVDMADRCGKPMLLGILTSQIYRLALNRGLGPEDNTRILEVMESLLGAQLETTDDAPLLG